MTVQEIGEAIEQSGVSAQEFWGEAMGGDMAELPAEDVERILADLSPERN